MKLCIICNDELNKENTTWYRQKNYIYKCNDCMRTEKRLQSRKFRELNPSLSRERSEKHRQRTKELKPKRYTAIQQHASAKKRAIALGVSFDLSTSYIESISPDICPVLLKKIKYGGGAKTSSSASLDRINSNNGYTRDNVQVICNLANMMKNSADEDELINFSSWVYVEYVEKNKGVSREA